MAVVSKDFVIDSSAALAFLRKERGGELAPPVLASGIMSAVNFAEVVQRFWRDGLDPEPYIESLAQIGLTIVAAEMPAAHLAGALERQTKPFGLSLADRFCLAEALNRRLPVVTTDRPFSELNLDIEIKRLR
jgi:ribonuclease VapC